MQGRIDRFGPNTMTCYDSQKEGALATIARGVYMYYYYYYYHYPFFFFILPVNQPTK